MRVFTGKVIATKMKKTATVVVDRAVVHPLYKKRFKRSKKYQVHDEIGVKVGDLVRFVDSRPYSKLKKWKIIEVIEKPGSGLKKDSVKKKSKKGEAKEQIKKGKKAK